LAHPVLNNDGAGSKSAQLNPAAIGLIHITHVLLSHNYVKQFYITKRTDKKDVGYNQYDCINSSRIHYLQHKPLK